MDELSFTNSIYSLLPPVLAITLAIVTRHVLLSLGVGIVVGVLLLTDFSLAGALALILSKLQSLVWAEGSLNDWNLYIIGFLFLLGVITTLVSVSGSAAAFAEWARHRIKNRKEAEFFTIFLGFIIFIDDYFNSLVVGSVAQPVCDRYNISRAKLAYLIDSTAAPVCVLMPISSWGAYISALISGILVIDVQQKTSSMGLVMELIPYNFYPLIALGLLFAVVYWRLDVGPMRHEQLCANKGDLYDHTKGVPPGINEELSQGVRGSVAGLFLPILSLVVATLFFMIYTGAKTLVDMNEPLGVLSVLEHLDLGFSLFYGALVSTVVAFLIVFKQNIPENIIVKSTFSGVMSMLPAVVVLLFAWTIASVINDLETGKYMAGFALNNIPTSYLPFLIFLLTGFISFSTGTSWGTFGIMLPIAADMALGSDSTMLFPMLSAVLSGAVFGDHCSPISDTTILSSTGAGCHHMVHVITQLPYALMAAFIAACGYFVIGVTHSLALSLVACAFLFLVLILLLKKRVKKG